MKIELKDYLSSPVEDQNTYKYFNLIRINSIKTPDNNCIKNMQEELLLSYADKRSYEIQFEEASEQEIIDYVNKKIPGAANTFDENVGRGDFGEVLCKLICEYFYNRTCFNKLKYKFNNKKSVFGTDVISFDDINNPSIIRYYEVKTRKKLGKESVKKGDPRIYISVIAHNSLLKDYSETFNSVLDFMFQRFVEEGKEDIARIFRDINKNKRTVSKEYEIFFVTEDSIANQKIILDELEKLPPSISNLSVSVIYVKDLYNFIDSVWNTIDKTAVEMFGETKNGN